MRRTIGLIGVLVSAAWTLILASAPQDHAVPSRRADPLVDLSPAVSSSFASITRYFGGSSSDTSHAMAVDSQRNMYIGGYTASPELLATLSAPDGIAMPLPVSASVFPYVAKFDSRGQLVYIHSLPADLAQFGAGKISLAIDTADSVYVAGRYIRSQVVGFVIKLDPSGNGVLFKTFGVDDTGFAVPRSLAVDARGGAVVVGDDGYVLKLNPQGQTMWRQHLGTGTGSEATAVAMDLAGSIYVAGTTNVASFPTTSGSFQPRLAPGSCVDPSSSSRALAFIPCRDAFITKLSPDGFVIYSSFFGGFRDEIARAIAVDYTGAATITGYTESRDLPTLNAAQPKCAGKPTTFIEGGGCADVFIAKLDPTGSHLVYATYYAGSGDSNFPSAVAIDPLGNAYVTGSTNSADWPTVDAMQPTHGNGPVFVSRNGGASWTSSSAGMVTRAISRFDGQRSDIVYAAGDNAAFRSTDGGATWERLLIDGRSVFGVLVDPANPSIVYGGDGGAGLYKSLDTGRTWTRLTRPPGCEGVRAISSAQTATLYSGNGASVCRSDDGGSTWRTVFTADRARMTDLTVLAADPRNAATAYASVLGQYYGFAGIWKTVDGGSTWNALGALPRLTTGSVSEQPPAKLLIDPTDPQTIYTTVTGGVVRSRDGGATWTPITDGLPSSRNSAGFFLVASYDIAQDVVHPQTIYALGNDAALYRSTDRGAEWQRVTTSFPKARTVAANNGRVLLGGGMGSDGFLVALDPYGRILTSTYVGGSGDDTIAGVKAVGRDAITIAGTTSSPYWPLAAAAGREYHGASDVFWIQMVRVSPR